MCTVDTVISDNQYETYHVKYVELKVDSVFIYHTGTCSYCAVRRLRSSNCRLIGYFNSHMVEKVYNAAMLKFRPHALMRL